MVKKITTLLLVVCTFFTAHSQELEFNQWQFAPALMNPALTGAYQGSFRIGGILRDDTSTTDPNAWKVGEAYIDAPIIRGFRKSDWVAVGISFNYGQAGDSKIKDTYQRVNLAYHLGWGKKLKSAFTIGAQFAMKTRAADVNDLRELQTLETLQNGGDAFLDNLMGTGMDQNLSIGNTRWNGGIGYKSQISKKNSIGFGISVSQFLETNEQNLLSSNSIDELGERYIGFFNMKAMTGKKTSFEPQVVFSRQQANSKLYLQGIFGYELKNEMVFKYGAGINALSAIAVPLYAGIEKGPLKIGLSYEIDLAETAATGTYGGLEIAASYIHILAKKPEPKPVIICPRL
jgi:type IX secretion system PorP/SprF family membrane protein